MVDGSIPPPMRADQSVSKGGVARSKDGPVKVQSEEALPDADNGPAKAD